MEKIQALNNPSFVKRIQHFENSSFMKRMQAFENSTFMRMNEISYFDDNYYKTISSTLTDSKMISVVKKMQEIYPSYFEITHENNRDIGTDDPSVVNDSDLEKEINHFFQNIEENDLSETETHKYFFTLSTKAKFRIYYLIYISFLFLTYVIAGNSYNSAVSSFVINLLSNIFHDKIQRILKPDQTNEEVIELIQAEISNFGTNLFQGKRVIFRETYLYLYPTDTAETIELLSIGQILTILDCSQIKPSWLKVEIIRENKPIIGYALRKFSTTLKE
ncbi:hypothetical protein Q674_16315 [Acinetobacter sp. COS3]|uniref:hypothetical protein n=1 Tax=Acinetobacter sp. COS3 TaxID=1397525 RepID=UPI0003B919D2|nr:hypothetical protein [Acinetobacter sp. COS3]ERS00009.1 hypothetical protein Q674_16315 [Acinetobacter sp. COS3]